MDKKELGFVLESKQINKYFVISAIAEAKCHFKNLNTRRFWEFALEKMRSSQKMIATQNFYVKDEDFLNNHPMIKSRQKGTEKVMAEIVDDIESNNFYKAFTSSVFIKRPRIAIVSIIVRDPKEGRTVIRLNQDFINFTNSWLGKNKKPVYVPIEKVPLLKCKTNEIYDFFMLLKKWGQNRPQTKKSKEERKINKNISKKFEKYGVFESPSETIRNHLHMPNENQLSSTALTRNLKSKCKQINIYDDIQVTVETIKINNKTAGYHFEIMPVKEVKEVKVANHQSDNGVIGLLMWFGITGKASSNILGQYSLDEIKAAIEPFKNKNIDNIKFSRFAYLTGILKKQTNRKYVHNK